MNNLFNLSRFGKLFVKHTAEHYKRYLMSITVLIGIMMLGGSFLVYILDAPIDKGMQPVMFVVILLFSGTLFTSTIFADLGDKKRAMSWLTLPATHLEKYLVAWLYSYVIFALAFTAGYYLTVLFVINIRHFPGHPVQVFNVFERPILQMYLLYAFLHGIAFFGAVVFEKLQFVKTGFIFFLTIAGFIFINKAILSILIGHQVDATPPFSELRISDSHHVTSINIGRAQEPYTLGLMLLLAIIFWVAAYFRLKE
jgi:hypothetical protein